MPNGIIIDAAAWYICFYFGFFHYIFTHIDKDKFKNINFEGISAGAHISTACILTAHGYKDMKHWFETGPKMLIRDNTYNNGRLTEGCYQSCMKLFDTFDETQKKCIKKYLKIIATTQRIKPYRFKNICDRETFATALAATSNIPIIGSKNPIEYKNKNLWDGYLCYSLGHYDYYNIRKKGKKKLVVAWKNGLVEDENFTVINLYDFCDYNYIVSFSPMFLNQTCALSVCDLLFEYGYNIARDNFPEFKEKFENFLS